jgi:hypothetical protein
VGLGLGATVLAVAVFILMFGGTILNGYGKRRVERAFAAAHPGSVLRIGELDYAVGANRLVASAVTLHAANTTLQVGRLSITDGLFRYCERLAVGADPAVLTVGAVSLSVEGIANRGDATAAIQIRGQGDLMNAGKMRRSGTKTITKMRTDAGAFAPFSVGLNPIRIFRNFGYRHGV